MRGYFLTSSGMSCLRYWSIALPIACAEWHSPSVFSAPSLSVANSNWCRLHRVMLVFVRGCGQPPPPLQFLPYAGPMECLLSMQWGLLPLRCWTPLLLPIPCSYTPLTLASLLVCTFAPAARSVHVDTFCRLPMWCVGSAGVLAWHCLRIF